MIELSKDTKDLIAAVIRADERERISNRLRTQVSENIPACESSNPRGMERIRFSVIRLLAEGRMAEDDVFALAYLDWRDLLMAAGHARSTEEHRKWAEQAIRQAALPTPPSDL